MFLTAVELADSRTSSSDMKHLWTELLKSLPALKSSTKLGNTVPTSFSVKLQRKLASTVPPRPIVQVSDEAALDHLERLCRDGSVVVEVLDYHDSHSLMVSLQVLLIPATDVDVDVCFLVSITKTSTFGIYPHTPTTLPFR